MCNMYRRMNLHVHDVHIGYKKTAYLCLRCRGTS